MTDNKAFGVTPSERFVASLCHKAFLKHWVHPNPTGKKGKELCDCLVVFDDHVIIISVKENEYKSTGDETGWKRWTKAAIDKSISQITGAERWLHTQESVETSNGKEIELPNKNIRKYHRIAIALGAHGRVPMKWGMKGQGPVIVCDEYSVDALFGVLDTVTDFVGFIVEFEQTVNQHMDFLLLDSGVEDILAFYILNGHKLNLKPENITGPGIAVFQGKSWKKFKKTKEFKAYERERKDSYLWDNVIEYYSSELDNGRLIDLYSKEVSHNAEAFAVMAKQPRLYRAALADALRAFIENPDSRSRLVKGFADTAFVFLAGNHKDRESRGKELQLRCLVVRG